MTGADRDRARARASAERGERLRIERGERPAPPHRLRFEADRPGHRWHSVMKQPVQVGSAYLLFTLLIFMAVGGLVVGLFWNA